MAFDYSTVDLPPVFMRHARGGRSNSKHGRATRSVPFWSRGGAMDPPKPPPAPLPMLPTDISMAEFERSFWARVWQCTHRHPCKRCCWPWREAFAEGHQPVRPTYGQVYVPHFRRAMATHRVATILAHHALILPFGRGLHLCHLCAFPPCCNPRHLVLGTPYDNLSRGTERIHGRLSGLRGPIHLPNGVDIMINYRVLRRSELFF
jgi:hypothetical protein